MQAPTTVALETLTSPTSTLSFTTENRNETSHTTPDPSFPTANTDRETVEEAYRRELIGVHLELYKNRINAAILDAQSFYLVELAKSAILKAEASETRFAQLLRYVNWHNQDFEGQLVEMAYDVGGTLPIIKGNISISLHL